MSEPIFMMNRVGYAYTPETDLFSDLSFSVLPGDSIALLGANGSGKSTLLKMLAGLICPQKGEFIALGHTIKSALLDDEEFIRNYYRQIGFIFQQSDVQLFTTRVWDEIAYGPLQMGFSFSEVRHRVDEIIELLNINDLTNRSPHHLSGGEKKKVALATVLVLNPKVLLLDEPSAGLDPRSQKWMVNVLQELHRNGRTLVISTHNLELAHILCPRSFLLSEDHQLVYDGPTADLLENHELLQRVNLVDEVWHQHEHHYHPHLYKHD